MKRMIQHSSQSGPVRTVFVSSYVPRECGIATYTDDVIRAVEQADVASRVVAMESEGEHFSYDMRVIDTIQDDDPIHYERTARLLNSLRPDVISVQHEFGIYGGDNADFVLRLLDALQIPVVVTFHTLLQHPEPTMLRVQREIADRVQGIVTMNGLARDILKQTYGVGEEAKIYIIHHGAPVPHRAPGEESKAVLGLNGQTVMSTFGLLNRSKGLEYMIGAMPHIVGQYADAFYYIIGQTHPAMRQKEGEAYRHMLQTMAEDLGVGNHVRFVDGYQTKASIIDYLLASDIYVTPYLNMEQVTSGTLAYAIGCGCPVVSTPYLHARYLLDDGRGILVPPADAEGLAEAVLTILDNPELRATMAGRNWEYGQTLLWPQVGAAYAEVFRQVAGKNAS
jgi:glycosyltransferase involved in cell wall biosynthesis